MHIPLQSGIDVGVTQNFAEGFGIKAVFHAAGGKGVTQGVKGKGIQPGPDQKALVFFQANAGGSMYARLPVRRYTSFAMRCGFKNAIRKEGMGMTRLELSVLGQSMRTLVFRLASGVRS